MQIDVRIPKDMGGWYYGRNKSGNLHGVQVHSGPRLVKLRPINSRSAAYSCCISLPIDSIPDVIQALIEVHRDAELHRSQS